MNADELVTRLRGARRTASGWRALCPAHADKNPSLTIHERDGRVLVYCHAGCSQEAVLAALMIEAKELLLDQSQNENRIVATYDYFDEQRNLLYQVVRYEPKDFRQRRPDGQGGYAWNLRGTRRVLYNLPEVIAEQSVIVVEGEKDVETARKLGVVATCNPGGAGTSWCNEFSEFLRGKQIAIISDADYPGRKHAKEIAASLLDKVASLKLLELPGAKDLTEWVERGGTREVLVEFMLQFPKWVPPSAARTERSGFNLTSLRDLLHEPIERVSWVLADKLSAGGISVLCAKPKVGKSTFARCLALAVARGEPFLGCATTIGPVIYLALEEKRDEVRRHFAELGATGEEEIFVHAASAPQDAVRELCELTNLIRPVLVIIDPLFKFVRIRDEKAYAEVCNAIEPLLTLARDSGAHVLLSHHSGKSVRTDATDTILGSTAIFGGVDTAIILKKADRYRTIQSCQRYGTDWPEVVLNFNPIDRSISLGVERSEADAEQFGDDIEAYLASCGEPQTRVQIEAAVEGKTTHKRAAIKGLCTAGRVSVSGAGSKGNPFRYELSQIPGTPTRNPSIQFTDSCSPVDDGTREQESNYHTETEIDNSDILVPELPLNSEDSATAREQEFVEGKL